MPVMANIMRVGKWHFPPSTNSRPEHGVAMTYVSHTDTVDSSAGRPDVLQLIIRKTCDRSAVSLIVVGNGAAENARPFPEK